MHELLLEDILSQPGVNKLEPNWGYIPRPGVGYKRGVRHPEWWGLEVINSLEDLNSRSIISIVSEIGGRGYRSSRPEFVFHRAPTWMYVKTSSGSEYVLEQSKAMHESDWSVLEAWADFFSGETPNTEASNG